MVSSSKARNHVNPVVLAVILGFVCTCGWAEDLTVSAQVDKTTVNIGEPVNLTVTLGGDMADVQVPALTFPEGVVVVARSQSSNFSIRAGTVARTLSLVYVLVPNQAGSLKLGPFAIQHQKKTYSTEPIDITVKKPALPPNMAPQGDRFTL